MGELLSFDPARCRVWNLHDRLEESINAETCSKEIASTRQHGQIDPAVGRFVIGDTDFDVELIEGARRLFVARHLEIQLTVDVRQFTDKQAVVFRDALHRLRRDVSPYERGMSYARYLRCGLFSSQDELASALTISASQVSRLLKIASLPSAIVGAFRSEADIRENWGLRLAKVVESDASKAAVMQAARRIACLEERPSPRDTFRKIIAAGCQRRVPDNLHHDKVVKASDGTPLFRVRQHADSFAVLVPAERVSKTQLAAIEDAIRDILEKGSNVARFEAKHLRASQAGEETLAGAA